MRRIRHALLSFSVGVALGTAIAVPNVSAQGPTPGAPQAGAPTVTADSMPSVALPPALERVLRDYERLWKAGDAGGLAEIFTDDGFVLSNFDTPVRGRAAIKERYKNAGGELRLRALSHMTEGSTGYIIGAYRYGNATTDNGKFVLALRRVGDRWLIAADMDNTNRRPRP